MSLNRSEDTSAPTAAKLTDSDSYATWGEGVALAFLNKKLLHELPSGLVIFPVNCSETLARELIYWEEATQEHALKKLKANNIKLPAPPEEQDYKEDIPDDASATAKKAATAAKKAWQDKQKQRTSDYNTKLAQYKTSLAANLLTADSYLKGDARTKIFTQVAASLSDSYKSAVQQVTYGDAACSRN